MNCFKNVFIHIVAVHFLYHFWYIYSSKTLFELLHVGEFGLMIHTCDHMFLVWFQYNIINMGISHPEKFYVLHLCSIFERAFLVLKILFRDGEDSFCAQVLSRQAQKPMFVSQNLQKATCSGKYPCLFLQSNGEWRWGDLKVVLWSFHSITRMPIPEHMSESSTHLHMYTHISLWWLNTQNKK